MRTITPLRGNLLIEPELRTPEKTESGIFLAPEFQGVPNTGTIFSAGEGCDGLEPGMRVMFKMEKAKGNKFDGTGLFTVPASQVVGIYE